MRPRCCLRVPGAVGAIVKAIPRIRTRTRRYVVRRIARSMWDMANNYPHLPAAGVTVALVALYFINR